MLTFSDFKNGVGGSFAEGLLKMKLDGIDSWPAFQEAALENRKAFSRPQDDDWRLGFYDAMWDRYGTASTGEKALMLAVLHAIDYDKLANDLAADDKRSFFHIIDIADDNFRTAAASCIARVN